jgi:hypothetical protein
MEDDQTSSSTCECIKSWPAQATCEHALSCNIIPPSVSMPGSFLLMAVAFTVSKGSTTAPHVAGDVRALQC